MTHPWHEFLDRRTALAGEYSLWRELGRGGMGIVSLARDAQLDRDIFIKARPSEVEDAAGRPLGAARTPTPA